jgi:16S rRNA (guanine527-N7)-methyltransferase
VTISEKETLFNNLVLEWNKKINLVSRKKTDVFDLIEESKLFFNFIDFSENPKILDLGTGGGFPGVVLKIHHPDARLTLVDSIRKKINALTDIINRLGLSGKCRIICARAEDLARLPEFKNSFDYVLARSVASLDRLSRWAKELLKPNGKLITIKGGIIETEIQKTLKFKFVQDLKTTNKNGKEIIEVIFR